VTIEEFNEVSASAAKRAWARLIKQVYEVDRLVCPRCGGGMRILAFIEQPAGIEKILTHLGLWPAHVRTPPAPSLAAELPRPGPGVAGRRGRFPRLSGADPMRVRP